eukprot:UN25624
MSGSQKIGLKHNWFGQPETFCQELCNNHVDCIGYIVQDYSQCSILPGDIGGVNVNTITGANDESRFKCMRKVVNSVSAKFGASGVTYANQQNFCRAIAVTLGGNTQYCGITDPNGLRRNLQSLDTIYMTIGVDDCLLSSQEINSAGFAASVQDLPAGTAITSSGAMGCNDGFPVQNVPLPHQYPQKQDPNSAASIDGPMRMSTFTLDGKYHAGVLRKMSPQLQNIFANSLGVTPGKVAVDIKPSVVQWRVSDTEDYTPDLNSPTFKDRLIANLKSNAKLSNYLGLTGDGSVICSEFTTAQDCWGNQKQAATGIFIPSGMLQACSWIPGIN